MCWGSLKGNFHPDLDVLETTVGTVPWIEVEACHHRWGRLLRLMLVASSGTIEAARCWFISQWSLGGCNKWLWGEPPTRSMTNKSEYCTWDMMRDMNNSWLIIVEACPVVDDEWFIMSSRDWTGAFSGSLKLLAEFGLSSHSWINSCKNYLQDHFLQYHPEHLHTIMCFGWEGECSKNAVHIKTSALWRQLARSQKLAVNSIDAWTIIDRHMSIYSIVTTWLNQFRKTFLEFVIRVPKSFWKNFRFRYRWLE